MSGKYFTSFDKAKIYYKKSQLDIIEGANHILVLNNPEQLEVSIESFLVKINF